MHYIIETYHRPEIASARDAALLAEARAFGVRGGDGIKSSNLYFLEGELSESDIDKLDAALFSEPVCEISSWRAGSLGGNMMSYWPSGWPSSGPTG